MSGTRSGPCSPWPVAADCGTIPTDPDGRDTQQQYAVETATELLWRLTAGQFGLCPERVRPCHTRHLAATPSYPSRYGAVAGGPVLADGRWINLGCGCTGSACGCASTPELQVPGPVHTDDPVTVTIDGTTLPARAVLVYPPNLLVRADGDDWPEWQHLDLPSGEVGTWSVDYTRGVPVPAGGQRSVALLASELHKACVGDRSCKLPARVQQITREGVTYTMLDPQDYLDQGRTGLTEVDMWLRAVNPTGAHSPPRVWSPDMPTSRRGTP